MGVKQVRADVVMTDDAMPEGFDRDGNAWAVTLRYGARRLSTPYYTGSMAGEPTAAGVVESLLLDVSCADESFEDWCADFGYDADSRRAERLYRACGAMRPKLRRFLGGEFDAAAADPDAWTRRHCAEVTA